VGKTRSKTTQERQEAKVTKDAATMRASFFANQGQEALDKMRANGATEEQVNKVGKLFAQAADVTDDGW
jgi:predicted acetyltransferase